MNEAEKAFQRVYQAWLAWRLKGQKNRGEFQAACSASDFAIVKEALGL